MAHQYIYTMVNLRKVVPPQREILKGIYLVSARREDRRARRTARASPLKIIAGVEKDFAGRRFPPKARAWFLPQDPRLDATKDVLGNVELPGADARAPEAVRGAQREARKSFRSRGEVAAEYQRVQDAIEAANAWELDHQLEIAMDALRLPPPDADVTKISGGEAPRRALRILLEVSRCAPGRPTNPRRRVRRLAGAPGGYPGTVVAVTHDRYCRQRRRMNLELDRGADPWKGNYSSWLEQEGRLELEEKAETAKRRSLMRLEWIKMSPRARHAKQVRIQATSPCSRRGPETRGRRRLFIPPSPRLGDVVAPRVRKAFGDQTDARTSPSTCRAADRRRHRTQRRRKDHALQDDRGQGEAGRRARSARPSSPPTWTRTATGRIPPRPSTTRFRAAGQDRPGQARDPSRVRGDVQLRERRSAEADRDSQQQINRLHLARTLKRGGNVLLLDSHERPRRRHAAGARGGSAELRRLPVVISDAGSGSHRHAPGGGSRTVWFEQLPGAEADRKRRLGLDAEQPHGSSTKLACG